MRESTLITFLPVNPKIKINSEMLNDLLTGRQVWIFLTVEYGDLYEEAYEMVKLILY